MMTAKCSVDPRWIRATVKKEFCEKKKREI